MHPCARRNDKIIKLLQVLRIIMSPYVRMNVGLKKIYFKSGLTCLLLYFALFINCLASAEKKDIADKEGIFRTNETDNDGSRANESMINSVVDVTKDAAAGTFKVIVSPLKASSEVGQSVMSAKGWLKQIPDIKDELSTTISGAGDAVSGFGRTVYDANEELVSVVVNVTKEAGGKNVEQATQNVVVPVRWANALGLSTIEYASLVANGKDPKMLIAVPVATAMRAARHHHYPKAKPLPEYIKRRVQGYYPDTVLGQARYVVGDFEFSLPNALNYGSEIFKGSENASVMGDVIIFGREPSINDDSDLFWWVHELHHVHQYHDWGIDRFAYFYVNSPTENGWIEKQADEKAVQVLEALGVAIETN